jgi:hypothetical protein
LEAAMNDGVEIYENDGDYIENALFVARGESVELKSAVAHEAELNRLDILFYFYSEDTVVIHGYLDNGSVISSVKMNDLLSKIVDKDELRKQANEVIAKEYHDSEEAHQDAIAEQYYSREVL